MLHSSRKLLATTIIFKFCNCFFFEPRKPNLPNRAKKWPDRSIRTKFQKNWLGLASGQIWAGTVRTKPRPWNQAFPGCVMSPVLTCCEQWSTEEKKKVIYFYKLFDDGNPAAFLILYSYHIWLNPDLPVLISRSHHRHLIL